MQKIKILYVLTVLNKGGLETMIMNYYRNFDKSKFDFHFLVHRDSGYFENELVDDGAFIHRVSPLSFSFRNFILVYLLYRHCINRHLLIRKRR